MNVTLAVPSPKLAVFNGILGHDCLAGLEDRGSKKIGAAVVDFIGHCLGSENLEISGRRMLLL